MFLNSFFWNVFIFFLTSRRYFRKINLGIQDVSPGISTRIPQGILSGIFPGISSKVPTEIPSKVQSAIASRNFMRDYSRSSFWGFLRNSFWDPSKYPIRTSFCIPPKTSLGFFRYFFSNYFWGYFTKSESFTWNSVRNCFMDSGLDFGILCWNLFGNSCRDSSVKFFWNSLRHWISLMKYSSKF